MLIEWEKEKSSQSLLTRKANFQHVEIWFVWSTYEPTIGSWILDDLALHIYLLIGEVCGDLIE